MDENDDSSLKAIPLPSERMRLASSVYPGTVYLFGGNGDLAHRIYAFLSDGTFRVIANLPDSVISVSDNSYKQVYIADQREIYRITADKCELVIRLPNDFPPILSIASAQDNNQILYFSTREKVFAIHGLSTIAVAKNLGGILRMKNEKLYVFDPERHILISMFGLTKSLLE
jgi:hypothetical protein